MKTILTSLFLLFGFAELSIGSQAELESVLREASKEKRLKFSKRPVRLSYCELDKSTQKSLIDYLSELINDFHKLNYPIDLEVDMITDSGAIRIEKSSSNVRDDIAKIERRFTESFTKAFRYELSKADVIRIELSLAKSKISLTNCSS